MVGLEVREKSQGPGCRIDHDQKGNVEQGTSTRSTPAVDISTFLYRHHSVDAFPDDHVLLKRFYDPKLAQASYLIGCPTSGEALVVDPNRDIESYLQAAANETLTIAHVTETHIHADFVSGARELAQRTGARLYLSNAGGPQW